jgi:RHS repeat-associated protein
VDVLNSSGRRSESGFGQERVWRWKVTGTLLVLLTTVVFAAAASAGRQARSGAHIWRGTSKVSSLRHGFAGAQRTLQASARKIPGARHGAPPARLGAAVPWLRRADSNTFMAGGGRLVTRVYPQPINYRARGGHFLPIQNRLVRSGGRYVQAANGLGISFPGSAGGAVRLHDNMGTVSLGLVGARGRAQVSNYDEQFAGALPGVKNLSFSSLSTGFGWKARVSSTSATRGLRWLARTSDGLRARLSRRGVQFVDSAGHVAWVLGAPVAYEPKLRRRVPIRLSLHKVQGGTLISLHLLLQGSSAAASGARVGAHRSSADRGPSAVAATPAYIQVGGAAFPGTHVYLGTPSNMTGDCYVSSAQPTTSLCLGDTNYVDANDHTLLNFDIADNVPSHVQVMSSFVAMQLSSESTSTAQQIGIWQASQPWTNQATWDSYDGTHSWTTPGGDSTGSMLDWQSVGDSDDVGAYFYWNLNGLVQNWVDNNPSQVDGLIFEPENPGSDNNTLGFKTETSSDDYPYLQIEYQPRMGVYPGSRYDNQRLTDRSTLGVNVANGDLMVSNNDLHIAGTDGLDLNVGRYYNNLSTNQTSFGLGWSMGPGADTSLWIPSDDSNTVDYLDGSGGVQTFYTDASGGWQTPPGLDASITMNGSNTYDSTSYSITFRHSGIKETFSAPGNELDVWGRLSSISDRNNNKISYNYNGAGQLSSIVDTHGAATGTTSFTYTSAGYVSTMTDPSGRLWQYFQNSSGYLTSYIDPAGKTTQYSYDSYGNLTQITTPAGNITNIAYDAGNSNRVTSVTRLVHPSDQSGPTTSYSYGSPDGSSCDSTPGWTQTTETDPNQHTLTYCADDRSRITKTIDGAGHTRQTSYTQDGYIQTLTSSLTTPTTFSYSNDGNDNVQQIQEGSGSSSITTKLQYADSSNPFLPTQVTDPQQNNVNYAYDGNGNLQSMTDQLTTQKQAKFTYNSDGTIATSTDPDGAETDYHYTNGNLTSIIEPGSDLNDISLSYDSENRVTDISSVSGSTGHEVEYTYDALDRITQAVYEDSSGNTVATISYSYDPDGNVLSRTDSHGTTSYTYDGLKRLTSESFPDGSSDSYGYDPNSNLTSLTDAGGTVKYGYSAANRLNSVTDPGASTATSLGYDLDGNLTKVTYPSGAAIVRTYNGNDQLTQVTDKYKTSSGAAASLSDSYTYTGALVYRRTDQAGNVTTYSYDPLNRLKSAITTAGPNPSTYSYTLDGNGNILTEDQNGAKTTYTYDLVNEILTGGGSSYGYDQVGDMTSNGSNWSASYNALGQMTSMTKNGTTTNYTYLGEGEDEAYTENGLALHNDLFGLASHQLSSGTAYFTRNINGQPISERTPSGTYNYLYDGQGSVIGLTDSNDHLVNQYSYDPYGNPITQTGSATNYLEFKAGYKTPAGPYHFGARFEKTAEARWTQLDPMTNIKSLTEANRYSFANDDPINLSDPGGEQILDFNVSIGPFDFGASIGSGGFDFYGGAGSIAPRLSASLSVGGGSVPASGTTQTVGGGCVGLETSACYTATPSGGEAGVGTGAGASLYSNYYWSPF